ncbi:MAG: helix-turn-helix domain-containing protein [Dehalococcoidia bacterium]
MAKASRIDVIFASKDEPLVALGRDPSELIGQPETVWLDFKMTSYQLAGNTSAVAKGKFELAKDVSAMANKDGGIIVMGVETEPDPATREDVAKQLKPIAAGLVDAKQIQEVIHAWVFPRLDVSVLAHAVEGEPGELWTISVERHRDGDFPHAVTKNFVEEGKANSNLFGVFERTGSHNVAYTPQQVQGWMNKGAASAREVFIMEPVAPVEEAEKILSEDLSVLGLPDNAASLILQAAPVDGRPLDRFYRGSEEALFDVLMSPRHHLRDSGFNLPDVGQPERTGSGALRVTWSGEDSLSVTPSGLATAVQGQRHLTWAHEKYSGEGEAWINPIALVEFVVDFWRFLVLEVMPRSHAEVSTWRVGMKNLMDGPVSLHLPRTFDHRAEKQQAMVDEFMENWAQASQVDACEGAYSSLERIYARFGFDRNVIPYTEGDRIDEETIRSLGS